MFEPNRKTIFALCALCSITLSCATPRAVALHPVIANGSSTGAAKLEDTQWVLIELNGRAATAKTREKAGNLLLSTSEKRIAAFAGCNSIGGSYQLNGDQLKFGPLISTRMACADDTMKIESEFSDALSAVTSFKLVNGKLELYGGGKLLARFEAR